MRIFLISLLALLLTQTVIAQTGGKLGHWQQDEKGLPCFIYTAKIPYLAHLSNGNKVKLPDDPWFLLGNYQFKLFTHVSGQYEMITGQRAWGRMNQGSKPNSGENSSTIEILNKKGQVEKSIPLTGMNSLAADPAVCKHIFGCGFADYNYKVGGLSIDRNLSVKPSTTPYNGTSGFLLTVKIKNNSSKKLEIAYNESILANYVTIQTQREALNYRKVKYINTVFRDIDKQLIGMHIKGVAEDPLLLPAKEVMSEWEGYPPSLFMKSISANAILSEKNNEIKGRYEFTLAKGEEKEISLIIGYTFENETSSIDQICGQLSQPPDVISASRPGSAFSSDWLKVLPKFDDENDTRFKQELTWHAYVLEAMATYSNYYKETKIPQGTVYDFDWGIQASARDNFQHALPLIYYNPRLAKSVLRYMLNRTTPLGDIRLIEKGNGYADATYYFTSDQQLYFFLLLSEYLRVTKDYDFLKEKVECFPAANQPAITVLDFVQNCFIFLRDQIGTGNHGLVRLMNSDWNDAIYYIVKAPYNRVLYTGESQMNSAMVISIFQTLIPDLDSAQNAPGLAAYKSDINRTEESMQLYRKSILDAFMKDLGDRKFPRRMYFNGKAYGEDNMFLEPQGFTLQINELPVERKITLYEEMKKRVYPGEILGAREQQTPEFEDAEFDKGSRENGGFWWALNGPVILGVAQFDKPEAWRLLKNMSFEHYENAFPQYWSSYWSASDNVESSLILEKGLPDQTDSYADQPVFCAHPHAWILYCYYKLHEMDKKPAN